MSEPAGGVATRFEVAGGALARRLRTVTLVVIGLGVIREIVFRVTGGPTQLTRLDFISLDAELAFGAWFSAFMMLIAALLLKLMSEAAPGPGSYEGRRWRLLAWIFVYLSA